jgi:tetratricopeptide (TPR) repeat protein
VFPPGSPAPTATPDLRYTALDRATIARLVATFPKTRLDLRHIDGDDELTDDPTWRQVHELVAEGGKLLADREPDEAVERFEQALTRCVPGARFAEYDQLYALYGTVEALGQLRLETTGEQHAALTERLVRHAEQALSLAPAPGGIFHFTDLGAFQEELTRRAGNALAWVLMERGELGRALAVIDRALAVADGAESDYVRDTKVRILLAAGRPGRRLPDRRPGAQPRPRLRRLSGPQGFSRVPELAPCQHLTRAARIGGSADRLLLDDLPGGPGTPPAAARSPPHPRGDPAVPQQTCQLGRRTGSRRPPTADPMR